MVRTLDRTASAVLGPLHVSPCTCDTDTINRTPLVGEDNRTVVAVVYTCAQCGAAVGVQSAR